MIENSNFTVTMLEIEKIDIIKKKIDRIAYNDPASMKKRRPETYSNVCAAEIIGREVDLEKIVAWLLQSDVQQNVSFLSIVGIGGLGKTALAQLVFNDPRVTDAFPLKLWTCISDLGQKQLDIEEILRKILAAISGEKNESATMDRVQKDIRAKLTENRYLLIFDDVWTEDREQWLKLSSFLMWGQRGSKILVTTRSKNTARIMGYGPMHELQGLSKQDSLHLFEVMAFGGEQGNPYADLLEIGREIVVQCANVSLAIRVMGSLLYGQDRRKWLLIQKHRLPKIKEYLSGVMPVLKLSYQQLEYPLKCCFMYCAIFPKDYVMEKNTLIRLWMAQGYVTPDEHGNMEDAAEEIFMVLLRRCFFQDIVEDEFGDIYSCKVNDLMHDIAREVAGKEIFTNDIIRGDMNKKVRHVHITSTSSPEYTLTKSSVRSYLLTGASFILHEDLHKPSLDTLLDRWKYLRVLCFTSFDVKNIPSSIGELLHLRYLDFSNNSHLKVLPRGITKLYNLQTLILKRCYGLRKLPKDMSKLVNLRVLDIEDCNALVGMPINISKLEHLQELTKFVVGKENSSWSEYIKSFEDLKAMRNLKGFLEITIGSGRNYRNVEKYSGGGYLLNKEHLNHVSFNFLENGEGKVENDEVILKELQPHSNVKQLNIQFYNFIRMPIWWQEVNLANLVNLTFENCPNLQCLGCVGKLYHLKHLYLHELKNLEFLIEDNTEGHCDVLGLSSSRGIEFSLFPSLETLTLKTMLELKGWCKGVEMGDNDQPLRLHQLTKLILWQCPNMVASVECPMLKILHIEKVNKKLEIIIGEKIGETTNPRLQLTEARIDNMKRPNSVQQMDAFKCLHTMEIWGDEEIECLGEGGEVFRSCSSSLQSLIIFKCSKLRSVSRGLKHLTALENLAIDDCPNLRLEEEEREAGSDTPMQNLNNSLRTLEVWNLPQLVNLPNWIQNLTSLQILDIHCCKGLKSLPHWMSNLTSLRELRIKSCSKTLEQRCKHSTGEDWPHIKHISTIVFED